MTAEVEIFPWNDNFATGIPEVDAQHRRLIELLNVLVSHLAYQSDAPAVQHVFKQLKEYTEIHFSFEERLWEKYFRDDAWLAWHRNAHTDFIGKVMELKQQESVKPLDVVIEEIVTFLTHWLAFHILEADRRMAKVVLALPSGMSLEKAKEHANDEMSGATRLLIDTVMGMYDKLANRTVMLTREIQRRKKAESELMKVQADLVKARDEAVSANIAKTSFLANVSHEIRTPLNAITGMAHLIRRSGVTPQQADRLNKIDAASSHLLEIVNGVLDLSKIEAGKFALESAPLEVPRLLETVLAMSADAAHARGLTLRIADADVPSGLVGDATRLQQALLNFVSNAVKFTESGCITLRARVQENRPVDCLVRFEVEDTGPGIGEDALGRLFSAFEQGDNSITRRYGGTGLGLAITRRLAEIMGGAAGVASKPGEGSLFWFTARLAKGNPAGGTHLGLPGTSAEEVLRANYGGRRVLLVDDEEVGREVAAELLTAVGLSCDLASDGQEAVSKALAQAYDVILMDMQMPRMDGLEATRRIRAENLCEAVPILAMTANAFTEDKARCLEVGMNDFITKPISPETLFSTLLKWLG